VAELWFSEQADLALRTLEADPTQDRLLAEVMTWLRLLEDNPGNAYVRRKIYVGGVRRIDLRSEAWMIAWQPHGDGDVFVRYIGPDF
jgi:hypothetical protein